MKFHVIAALCTALCFAAGSASASSIGVFFAPDASDCDLTLTEPGTITWYICGILGGDPAAGGVTGAEFRQTGTPEGWFATVAPNSNAGVSLGNPLGGGCNIAFPACQEGQSGVLLLYTITAFAASVPGPTYLSIEPHSSPSNADFQCSLFTLCDFPDYTMFCVPGGQAIINGPSCSVGVEGTTWSHVKGLYSR